MKEQASFSRYTILWIVILCYLLPVFGLSAYANWADSWEVLSLGLLVASLGSLAIFSFMLKMQSPNNKSFARYQPPDLADQPITSQETLYPPNQSDGQLEHAFEENRRLLADIDALTTQLQLVTTEKEEAAGQIRQNLMDWEAYRQQVCQQMEEQQAQIHSLQETLAERQSVYEKKQQQIGVLESKVGDLTYEIKTLLQLAEAHTGSLYAESQPSYTSSSNGHAYPSHSQSPPEHHHEEPLSIPLERQVRSTEEASLQLKRCIDIAQKITGSQRFSTQFNAFRDYPADGFALDLRRLCDSLRSENNSTILLYSPKENQLLFANNQIRGLTGWSPDKFVQNFNDIIQDEKIWRQGINSLAMRSESSIEIPIKTKSGQDIMVHAHLGMIPTGIFKNHAIAVMYLER